LEPKVAVFYPSLQEQWQALASRLATLNTGGSAQRVILEVEREAEQRGIRQRDGQRQQDPLNQMSAETLLDRAQKTNNFAQRDNLYRQAALSAAIAGDFSQALEITGRISDMGFRDKVRAWINFDAALKAITDKRYDEARKYALDIEETDQRAYLFFEMAGKALGDKDHGRALELLEEAAKRAGDADDTSEKVKALCGIANLYLKIDQAHSFSFAEAAVRAANRIPADKFKLGEDDSKMSRTLNFAGGTHTNTWEVKGFDMGKVFGWLAGHNFDRTLALAQTIENKNLKYRLMIAVAESALMKR
jgi:tetratricopeptide (TPR) repeat protein